MSRILIVDDEVALNTMIKRSLSMVGFECDQAYDGNEVIKKLQENTYSLILLDVMLPSISGFELMKQIHDIPIIFLTAKDNIEDKLYGLTSGAEDYIVKPFEMLELIARIHIVLRRTDREQKSIVIGDLDINLKSKQVRKEGILVELTPQEYNLLEVLVLNKNLALSREQLIQQAWGYDYEGETKTVDVHIQKLRKKLSLEDHIKTVYKLGYRMEV